MEFLHGKNRLDVALSRARCLAPLVASPKLMGVKCHTVEQIEPVNTLCRVEEHARRFESLMDRNSLLQDAGKVSPAASIPRPPKHGPRPNRL